MTAYLILGVVFMGIVDILHWLYLEPDNPKHYLGWRERLFIVLAWPWALYVLVKNFMDVHK